MTNRENSDAKTAAVLAKIVTLGTARPSAVARVPEIMTCVFTQDASLAPEENVPRQLIESSWYFTALGAGTAKL